MPQASFAQVALPLPLDQHFTYTVPERLIEGVVPGVRVMVPFRRQIQTGYVVSLVDSTDVPNLKSIQAVLGRLHDLEVLGHMIQDLIVPGPVDEPLNVGFETLRRGLDRECRELHSQYVDEKIVSVFGLHGVSASFRISKIDTGGRCFIK